MPSQRGKLYFTTMRAFWVNFSISDNDLYVAVFVCPAFVLGTVP